jgi:uncharacterized protein (DUF4415 family)
VDAFTEEEIERMAREDGADDFEWTTPKLIEPAPKQSIHLRVDADVLAWFRANSTRHLTHMNSVLRQYVQAKSRAAASPHG